MQGRCINMHRQQLGTGQATGRIQRPQLEPLRRMIRLQQTSCRVASSKTAGFASTVPGEAVSTTYLVRPGNSHQQVLVSAAVPQHQHQHQSRHNRDSGGSSSSNKLAGLLLLLRSRPATSHPALLTAAIKATSSWQQAAALFTEHSHAFNHIHTAAFISHLPKVLSVTISTLTQRQQSDTRLLLEDISQLAEELLHDCSDRELANMAHGFASLGYHNRRLMQLVLCRCDLAKLKPQELSNLTWAVAKLGHEMHEGWVEEVLDLSMKHMQQGAAEGAAAAEGQPGDSGSDRQQDRVGFKPQEICNIAWGLAMMQRRCLLYSAPPLRHRCTVVDAAWKAHLCGTVAAQIRQCSAADVSMCLWSLAVLGFRGVQQHWLDLVLLRAVELVGVMQGRHIAVVLWATSRLTRQQHQQRPPQQQSLVATVGGQGAESSLQRFASACFPVVHQLLLVSLQYSQQQQQQQQQHGRGQLKLVCVLLLSCAHLGLQPSAATMAAMLAVTAQQLQAWTVQQQQQHSLGPFGHSGSDLWHQWSNVPGPQQQRQQRPGVTVHDVGTLLYGLARLSFHPGQHFVAAAIAAATAAIWQQVLVPAAARRPEQQQDGPPAVISSAAGGVQGKELAMLAWALAKLHCKPSNRFLWLLRVAAVEQLDTFSSRDVAVMFWSLSQMRHAPQFKWVRRMLRQFLARLDDSVHTAPDICQVLNALPCLPSTDAKNLHRIMLHELDDLLPQLAAAAAVRFGECRPRELVGMLQGFARLGYWPGWEWQQQHWQQCEVLQGRGVLFSEREQQILEHSRITLAKLAEQQQQQQEGGGDISVGRVPPAVVVQLQQPLGGNAHHSRHRQLAAAC